MSHETEISEPWTVDRLLARLAVLQPLDANEAYRELRREANALARALREALPACDGKAIVSASALLLMLANESGREPFLEALNGPDGDVRTRAISYFEYCIFPRDLPTTAESHATPCPISSDELFEALKRDLREPWENQNLRVLEIVAHRDFPQARSITRRLLACAEPQLRNRIAASYLLRGRDDGALAVAEKFLRSAPVHAIRKRQFDRWPQSFELAKSLWGFLEFAAERGNAALQQGVALLAMEFAIDALNAPDCAQRFDVNDGLVSAGYVAKILAAVAPNGAEALLARMMGCEALSDYDRGQSLLAYARVARAEARPILLAALRDKTLRTEAANAMTPLARGANDPEDILALSNALSDEDRPGTVAALAKALLEAGPDGRAAVEGALEHAEPWTRVELSWRINGGDDREFVNLLVGSGVMDPITDEQLTETLSHPFDVRGFIYASGRLAQFGVKTVRGYEHYKLFQDLVRVARPPLQIDELRETMSSEVFREPIPDHPDRHRTIKAYSGGAISFSYAGIRHSFDLHPQGRWHDVPAVMKGFDDFMQSIGREDRCYELEGGGEWALFVVAPSSRFEPIAARLRIPLERDSESARDAAKAYQRQIQNM